MKERYVKPIIHFESFGLSQSIARQCRGDDSAANSNHYSEHTGCSYDAYGEVLFYTSIGCETDCEPDEGVDLDVILEEYGVCYNNPEDGYQVFSST